MKIALVKKGISSISDFQTFKSESLENLINSFKVVYGWANKQQFLAKYKEGVIQYLNIESGEWSKDVENFKPENPSAFNEDLIKDEDNYFYLSTYYGQCYRIKKQVFVKEIRDIADQFAEEDRKEGKKVEMIHQDFTDEELVKTSFFRDVLDQNFGESLADNVSQLELIADISENNKELMSFILKASARTMSGDGFNVTLGFQLV